MRKDQFKPAIKQEYASIWAVKIQQDSTLLFGNDLAKTLKEAKEASDVSLSMKNSLTKPYFNNKKTTYPNKTTPSYTHEPRNFLWKN